MKNLDTSKIALSGSSGSGARATSITTTDEGKYVLLHSSRPILVCSYDVYAGSEDVEIEVKYHLRNVTDPDVDGWRAAVAAAPVAAESSASTIPEGLFIHCRAVMVTIASAAAGVHSTGARIDLLGTT